MVDGGAQDSLESSRHDSRRGKSKLLPSNWVNSRPHHTRAERTTQHAEQFLELSTPLDIQQKVADLVGLALQKHLHPSEQQIKEGFQGWISNSRFSRSRDTKAFRAMEFYLLAKTLIALSMENKEDPQAEIMDQLRRMEAKFLDLSKVLFRLSLKVSEWVSGKEEETVEVVGTPVSQGTNSNPNIIEDELGQEVMGKANNPKTSSQPGPFKPPPS